jgi:LmbE family N-acetylglucosaminyl deacetylase
MLAIKKAIVLAPHPDDGEFSSGGTIKKLSEQGVKVVYAAFSPCEKSVPKGFAKDVLYKELNKAVTHLGIDTDNVITFNFPVRDFHNHRQDILEKMVGLKKEFNPDLVLLPSSHDNHQDHEVIHNEGVRAFKHSCILGYEMPWNNFSSNNNYFVKLTKSHLGAKHTALLEYKSQKFRKYNTMEFFTGLATVRGTQVNCDFAEAFEVIRWIN